MRGRTYSQSLLAALVQEIKSLQLNGQVSGQFNNKTCELYFVKGELIHAFEPENDTSGDEVLYDLINWKGGELIWNPQFNKDNLKTQTIDDEQAQMFYNTLKLLQKQGMFEQKPANLQLLEQEKPPAEPNPPANKPSNIVGNWPLLYGVESLSLRKKIDNLNIVEQYNELQKRYFSGYLTYSMPQNSPVPSATMSGLLVFELGRLTTARVAVMDMILRGQDAFDAIVEENLPLQVIIELEPALVTAYRSYIEGYTPFSNVPATSANFSGLQSAFSKQQRSGVIRYRNPGQSEIYYLIDKGAELGIYGSSPLDPELWKKLSINPVNMWGNSEAQLDVFVAKEPEQIKIGKVNKVAANLNLSNLLTSCLQQIFDLIGQITTPLTAYEELIDIARKGSLNHPPLRRIVEIRLDDPNTLPNFTLINLARAQANFAEGELIGAYEYLLNNFSEKYIARIGEETFSELANLSLGADKERLQKAGIQFDFLKLTNSDEQKALWNEIVQSYPTEDEEKSNSDLDNGNAFDF